MVQLRDIDDLAFFVGVARAGSLTGAAHEWGVSVPQVSKRLAALETRLGARLVRRSTRGLRLTPEGETYATRARELRREITALEDSVGDPSMLRGPVSVVCTPGIGRAHVAPLLGRFAARHPQVAVRLELSSTPVAVIGSFDVAIGVGVAPEPRFDAVTLAPNRRLVVAAPSYRATHGLPAGPDDLPDHNCVVLREHGTDYALWRFVVDGAEVTRHVTGTLSSNDGNVVTDWCVAGLGLAMRSAWHVAPLLAHGDLVVVMPEVDTPPAPVVALMPHGRLVARRVTSLVDFLAAELPATIPLPPSPLPAA